MQGKGNNIMAKKTVAQLLVETLFGRPETDLI